MFKFLSALFECSRVFLVVDMFLKDFWCSQCYGFVKRRHMHISGEFLHSLEVPPHSSELIYNIYKGKLEAL